MLAELNEITVSFITESGSHITVLKDFSAKVESNQCLVLMGPNGVGKSTLLNVIAGILEPESGTISYTECKNHSIVFQRYEESLFDWFTVAENITYPLKVKGVERKVRYLKALEINNRLKFDLPLDKYPYELSGGQKQRVAIARALITDPDVIFLDEPFASLDIDSKKLVLDSLNQLIDSQNITVVLATHEIRDTLSIADEVWFLAKNPAILFEKVKIDLPRPRVLYNIDDKTIGNILNSMERALDNSFQATRDLKRENTL
jgi:NitT/TauT family transport system ATP-binding protein